MQFQGLLFLLLIFSLIMLGHSICDILFDLENYKIHKKRLKQLKFNNKRKSDEEDVVNLIDRITKPVIRYILPNLRKRNEDELNRDLKLAGWSKYFTAKTYVAMNITLKIVAVIIFVLLFGASKALALIWFLALFFGFGFLFKNSLANKKEVLLLEFPDFIRITQGYLMAGMPFVKVIEKISYDVGNNWKPILQDFTVNCEVKSIEEAMDILVYDTDIIQVRELFALIKLNLEQGIEIKDSFENQADKIRDLQMEIFEKKILKRKLMCICLQLPIFIIMFTAFGLPTFYSMMHLTTM